jgi:hypothetical protein
MKNKKQKSEKIAAECLAGISAQGPSLLAWPSSIAAQPA